MSDNLVSVRTRLLREWADHMQAAQANEEEAVRLRAAAAEIDRDIKRLEEIELRSVGQQLPPTT